MSCEAVQERLTEALLARAAPAREDASHAAGCPACGTHARALDHVGAHLALVGVPPLRATALEACQAGALRVLRAQRAARAPTPLRGLGPDFFRAGLLALLVLPVALGHAWLVAWAGRTFLGPWLPGAVLDWLALLYFVPVALALGVLYGAIPLAVAMGRRHPLEET